MIITNTTPRPIIVDIGADIGQFNFMLAGINPDCTFVNIDIRPLPTLDSPENVYGYFRREAFLRGTMIAHQMPIFPLSHNMRCQAAPPELALIADLHPSPQLTAQLNSICSRYAGTCASIKVADLFLRDDDEFGAIYDFDLHRIYDFLFDHDCALSGLSLQDLLTHEIAPELQSVLEVMTEGILTFHVDAQQIPWSNGVADLVLISGIGPYLGENTAAQIFAEGRRIAQDGRFYAYDEGLDIFVERYGP